MKFENSITFVYLHFKKYDLSNVISQKMNYRIKHHQVCDKWTIKNCK